MSDPRPDSFGSRSRLDRDGVRGTFWRLSAVESSGCGPISRLPYALRILLENLLRREDGVTVTRDDIAALAAWNPHRASDREIAFMPARVLLQDFTGVPAVVDLAALREAVRARGGDPRRVDPLRPADLVIDHSVQVDQFGTPGALTANTLLEHGRNQERYVFLRWGQRAFRGLRVVPPGTGIVHQVNLEHLAQVVLEEEGCLFPDTLVGTDSHTTMINGLGVLGWGVGGIEAEAAMLGQPMPMLLPAVVGFRLRGRLPAGSTATDLVLTATRMLRAHGVVGAFVEFFGDGLEALSLPDRATLANMAPEYGATVGFVPVDDETLRYLRLTGRPEEVVRRVEVYCKEQGLFRTSSAPEPTYTSVLDLDLAEVGPSLAGPRRPQDLVPLAGAPDSFRELLATQQQEGKAGRASVPVRLAGEEAELGDGAVVIAAITSCTNTSNPSVMLGAGLLAQKAVARGLRPKPWVKTSLAPGSLVVADYLRRSGLMAPLEALGFHLVGFGCTTCIGNSGPLPEPVAAAVRDHGLVVAAVLSGNRNFEGRIHPQVRANYLASPPLVVAYALAGDMGLDLEHDPLGTGSDGKPVFLRDLWPTPAEVRDALASGVDREMFVRRYAEVFDGDETWRGLSVPEGDTFAWDEASTYIRRPPYLDDMPPTPLLPSDIRGARVLALLGDSVTTDHISPAGSIPADGPAGRYLIEQGIAPSAFNSFGSRRGNHEVMVRGTFGNIRLRNRLAPGTEGGWTDLLPGGERLTIYDAAQRYRAAGVPLLVIAGKEYGTGSSRDWAAKGTALLGVRAVIAESYERIHRSNLAGMGVLPLQFPDGVTPASIGLDGRETYDVEGLSAGLSPRQKIRVTATAADGTRRVFEAISRLDTPGEVDYYRHGGILPFVLRRMVS